jgi:hypothetical protein
MESHIALVITCAYSDALTCRRVRYSFNISEVPASKPILSLRNISFEHEKESIRRLKEKSDSAFSINYRELLGAYFSVILWCAEWSRAYGRVAHIRMVIDNVSAVAWTDTRNTTHPEALCSLRIMGLLEAISHVFTSSEHIPGEKNVWADAGSRSWDTEDSMLRFKNLSTNNEQVAVPEAWRNPSRAWQKPYDGNPWPEIARINIKDIGCSGSSGAK